MQKQDNVVRIKIIGVGGCVNNTAISIKRVALGTYRAYPSGSAFGYRYLFSSLRMHPLSGGIKKHYDGLGAFDIREHCLCHYHNTVLGIPGKAYKF